MEEGCKGKETTLTEPLFSGHVFAQAARVGVNYVVGLSYPYRKNSCRFQWIYFSLLLDHGYCFLIAAYYIYNCYVVVKIKLSIDENLSLSVFFNRFFIDHPFSLQLLIESIQLRLLINITGFS